MRTSRNFLLFGLAVGTFLSASQTGFAAVKKDSLYNRLGQKKAITAVVDKFVTKCATDDRIKNFFVATAADPKRLHHFKASLVAQICEASGGPCKYKGKNMKDAHAGMGVKEADFNALVENLAWTLDSFKVAPSDKNMLLGVLAPMKGDIVESGSSTASKK